MKCLCQHPKATHNAIGVCMIEDCSCGEFRADLESRIAELEAALLPFAEINVDRTADYRDGMKILVNTPAGHNLTIGDIRKAKSVMSESNND